MSRRQSSPGALAAEFLDARTMVHAVRELRSLGYRDLDAYSPYDLPELTGALGLRRSRIPWIVFFSGLLGAIASYWIQWFANVARYPQNAGGRPAHAIPAFIFPTFEGTILIAALGAMVAFLVANRFPRLWAPITEAPGFDELTTDRFWLTIRWRDVRADPERGMRDLGALGPTRLFWIGGEP